MDYHLKKNQNSRTAQQTLFWELLNGSRLTETDSSLHTFGRQKQKRPQGGLRQQNEHLAEGVVTWDGYPTLWWHQKYFLKWIQHEKPLAFSLWTNLKRFLFFKFKRGICLSGETCYEDILFRVYQTQTHKVGAQIQHCFRMGQYYAVNI